MSCTVVDLHRDFVVEYVMYDGDVDFVCVVVEMDSFCVTVVCLWNGSTMWKQMHS